MATEVKLDNLTINKVDSQETFESMQSRGLVNEDELYLVGGDNMSGVSEKLDQLIAFDKTYTVDFTPAEDTYTWSVESLPFVPKEVYIMTTLAYTVDEGEQPQFAYLHSLIHQPSKPYYNVYTTFGIAKIPTTVVSNGTAMFLVQQTSNAIVFDSSTNGVTVDLQKIIAYRDPSTSTQVHPQFKAGLTYKICVYGYDQE